MCEWVTFQSQGYVPEFGQCIFTRIKPHAYTDTHTHTPSYVFGDLLVNNEGAAHGLCYYSALRYQNA